MIYLPALTGILTGAALLLYAHHLDGKRIEAYRQHSSNGDYEARQLAAKSANLAQFALLAAVAGSLVTSLLWAGLNGFDIREALAPRIVVIER